MRSKHFSSLVSPVYFIGGFVDDVCNTSYIMSKGDRAGAQQTSLLDVLKKKMRQAREEAEAAKDEADEVKRMLEEERKKREEVCS